MIDAPWQTKMLRRRFGSIGWSLLVYYGLMNACVLLWTVAQTAVKVAQALASGVAFDLYDFVTDESGWGYLLAIVIGIVILLAWKKPRFWKEEIWAPGNPITITGFFRILAVFLSGQMIYQILAMVAETVLNAFGLSMMEGMMSVSMDTEEFGMFLYGAIGAPIAEELLFRGLVQRTLQPYGKRFAIFGSAFAFGIFHGNLLQSPYAFLVGLVLGYTAAEYSIGWAMVLHMINNLVVGDMLTRLSAQWPDWAAALLFWGILLVSFLAALVILVKNRKKIRAYGGKMNKLCLKCFFTSPGMIVLMIVMGLSMILSAFWMITPL